MISTLSDEHFAPVEDAPTRGNLSSRLKSRLGHRLDEIAVFALVAVAMVYIAAAGCWFIW